jgi:hypothetical protein
VLSQIFEIILGFFLMAEKPICEKLKKGVSPDETDFNY